jgi:Uma2 family endonuclease
MIDTGIKKYYTIDDFDRMRDAGVFHPDAFYELIRGEIVEMPRPRPRHIGRVNKLTDLFTSTLGQTVIVSVQNEVVIEFPPDKMSLPRPDVAILKRLPELFGPFGPAPEDVLLLIEVSDTSEAYDHYTKIPLYADAGIGEYWILNIPKEILEVRTDPMDGRYRKLEILKPGQTVVPRNLAGFTFAVADILT